MNTQTAARRRATALAGLALLGLALLGVAACGPRPAELRIYNWSDYIDPALLADFTRETGIRVVYDTFDSNEVQETRLLAGGSGYDIVTPSNNNLARLVAAGAIRPLSTEQLPNLRHLRPDLTARLEAFDPGGRHGVPYMWGTIGLGYNARALAERLPGVAPDSWRLVFDPGLLARFADCGVYFLDAGEDMYALALNYMGRSPNSADPADYQAATELLMKVRPFVRKFHSSEYITALANGDICLAVGYSGDVLQARDRAREAGAGVEVGYTIPVEGTQLWFDLFAVPVDAPSPEAAHRFLDFMLRPEVIARASDHTRYANANAAATALLAEAIRGDPHIYPPPEVLERMFVTSPKDPALLREVNRHWTRVLAGR